MEFYEFSGKNFRKFTLLKFNKNGLYLPRSVSNS